MEIGESLEFDDNVDEIDRLVEATPKSYKKDQERNGNGRERLQDYRTHDSVKSTQKDSNFINVSTAIQDGNYN